MVTSVGCLFMATLIATTTLFAARRHRVELSDSARELRTLDLLLAEEASRSFLGVKLLLDGIADQIAAEGISTPEAFVARMSTSEMHDALKAQVNGVPQADAVTVIGTDGKLLNFSRAWPVPKVDVSDRDYFLHLKEEDTTAPFLSEPVVNRGTGTPTVYLARRVSGPGGRFLGLVLGAIELRFFQRLYASLNLGQGNLIALWRDDGVLLTRFPSAETGQRVNAERLNAMPQGEWHGVQGVIERRWGLPSEEPTDRIVASTRASGFPVLVNIAREKSIVLADWKREVAGIGAVVLLALLLTAALLWAIVRRLTALEATAVAFRDREAAVQAQRKAEEGLRQSQKMEAVGQLTGGIAHDFNNMLAVVIGSLDLGKRRLLRGNADIGRYIDTALDGANRAAALTQRLLAFSRRQALEPKPTDVNALIAGLIDLLERTLGGKIEIVTDLDTDAWRATADPNQLEHVVLNLCVNARDAMPEGGRLRLGTRNEDVPDGASDLGSGSYIVVEVEDTGTGMPPDVLARAFDPFFTTKPVGHGTGLGLSQAIGFARQSGGDLRVRTMVGTGTTFSLYLPRCLDEARTTEAERGFSIPSGGELRMGAASETVLVVEDEDRVRAQSVEALKELGYRVLQASGGEEALGILDQAAEVTLLFTDVMMPGMDGWRLAELATERRPGLKVLHTSGFIDTHATKPGRVTRLLNKPFTVSELAHTVRETLDVA